MKRLTRIKLIHWHYFVDETIPLKGSALLTGENGSGKSTILDAIQFALVGDQRKVRFNVSALEETQRDLRGYLRGKTGSDTGGGGLAALREGEDFTTYVALEFFDTRAQTFFLVGTVIDSYTSGDMEIRFFKLENQELDNQLFFAGARPRNIGEFRRDVCLRLPGGRGRMYQTAETYREDLKHKLGHLSDRFFNLLVKALAFKPITDLRDFVYTYVLEERHVNIDVMRDNLQNYRHFEALLQQTKEKIEALEAIAGKHRELGELERRIRIQDYVILRAGQAEAAEQAEHLQAVRDAAQSDLETCRRRLEELKEQEEVWQERVERLREALGEHAARQRIQQLEQEIDGLSEQLEKARGLRRQLEERAAEAEAGLAHAASLLAEAQPWLGLSSGPAGPEDRIRQEWLSFRPVLRRLLDPAADGEALRRDLMLLASFYRQLRDQVLEQRARLRLERERLQGEAEQIEADLRSLERRQRVYDPTLLQLQRAIREEVRIGGEPVSARVFCELLEVPDETWQNAVEGYLNTQRFDLFVPPEAFDQALAVYERRKRELRISNIGLVNGAKILAEDRPPLPGSLAEEVVASDPLARAYANRLLGRLMKCRNEQELKRHPLAITASCMTYRNHVARQIAFQVYETWYIGERSFVRQVEVKKRSLAEIRRRIDELALPLRQAEALLDRLTDPQERFERFLELRAEAAAIPGLEASLQVKWEELASIDRAEVQQLETAYQAARNELQELRDEAGRIREKKGGLEERLQQADRALAEFERRLAERSEELRAYAEGNAQAAEEGERRFAEARRQQQPETIRENFERSRQGHQTQANEKRSELFKLRFGYNQSYQFGGAPEDPENAAYAAELQKLVESELPAYETQIADAKRTAEEEFKEHFIYKLKEHIETAHSEFSNLNRVLKEITFGQDRYLFQVQKASEYAAFYDMITDESLMEGLTLFSAEFQRKHQATIDRLFDEILDVSEEQQARNIEKFTDYRTYLDYDIKIHHADGEVSSFSKVAREKSGGETQTPYYVAIVASFLQLYRYRFNEDSVRLMLFDEAFNRMDLDRIENTLRFINQLDLQLICAAPTDKAEVIAPLVTSTLLVIRDGHRTWLQDYHQFMVEEGALDPVAADGADGVQASSPVKRDGATEVEAAAARDEG